jgi:hypothetical protein
MSTIINIFNGPTTPPSNTTPIPVIVDPYHVFTPQDLIWVPGGNGFTLNGGTGTIFADLTFAAHGDQVSIVDPTKIGWYHQGFKLNNETIEYFGENIITASVAAIDVISDTQTKGVVNINKTTPMQVTNVTIGTSTYIETVFPNTFVVGDYVEITGSILNVIPQGIYRVESIVNSTHFYIAYDSSSSVGVNIGADAAINLHNYVWDEIYTTPLGLYETIASLGLPHPNTFQFRITSDNSNELVIYIEDPNIIPKINDTLVIQKFNSTIDVYNTGLTTDGINNVRDYINSETYEFKITAVSSLDNPLGNITPYIEYTLTLDKNFVPIIEPNSYILTLLNREDSTVDKELFSDTWRLIEINREQLLGDPVVDNFLNYQGADYLGVSQLLAGVIPQEPKTPIVLLTFADNIKDRIYTGAKTFELYLPNILIQGETSSILTNLDPVLTDFTGTSSYGGLYLKYPTDTVISPIRYGWVFYDLRIIVIDHAELATALSYNANRNYTLPTPVMIGTNDPKVTIENPVTILNASNATPIQITTLAPHNFINGDQVRITGVLGNTAANNVVNGVYTGTAYYAQIIDDFNFTIYQGFNPIGPVFSSPVIGNGSFTNGPGAIVYGIRLKYEYFFTYKLKGVHYTNTLPSVPIIQFNWQLAGKSSDDTAAFLNFSIDKLTHLLDTTVLEGFRANSYDIIIGKYVQDITDFTKTTGVQDVVILPQSLKDFSGNQIVPLTGFVYRYSYDTAVTNASILTTSDPTNPKYDIFNIDAQQLYNVSPLPTTLFTSEGMWLEGIVKFKEHAQQYRLTLNFVIPANKWNGTENLTFVVGDPDMTHKLISEVAFLIEDSNNNVLDNPYIYAKISPPLQKNNKLDITISFTLDF